MPPRQNPQLDSADEAETDFDFAEGSPADLDAVEETHPEHTSGELWQSVSKSAWGIIETASKITSAPTADSHDDEASQAQRTPESPASEAKTNHAKVYEIATHAATAFQSTGTMLYAAVAGNMAAMPQAPSAVETTKPLAMETAATAQNVYESLWSAATELAHQAKINEEDADRKSQESAPRGDSKGGAYDFENSSSAKPGPAPEAQHGTAKGGSYYSETSDKTDSAQESNSARAKTEPSHAGQEKAGYHDQAEGSAAKAGIPEIDATARVVAEQAVQPGSMKDWDETKPPSSKTAAAVNTPPDDAGTAPAPRAAGDMNYPAMDSRRPPDRNETVATTVAEAKPAALEGLKAAAGTAAGIGDLPAAPRISSEQQTTPAISNGSTETSKPRTEFGSSRTALETAHPITESVRPQPTALASALETRAINPAPVARETTAVASIRPNDSIAADQTANATRPSSPSHALLDKTEHSVTASSTAKPADTVHVLNDSSTAASPPAPAQFQPQAQLKGEASPLAAVPATRGEIGREDSNCPMDTTTYTTYPPQHFLQTDGRRVAPHSRMEGSPPLLLNFSPSPYLRTTVDFGLLQRVTSTSPVPGELALFTGRPTASTASLPNLQTIQSGRTAEPFAGTRTEVTPFQPQGQRADALLPNSTLRHDVGLDHTKAHATGRILDGGKPGPAAVGRSEAARETAFDVSGKVIDAKPVRLSDFIRSAEGRSPDQVRQVDQVSLTKTFDLSGRQVRNPGYQGPIDARLGEAPVPITRDLRYTNNGKRYLITEIGLAFVLAAGGIRRVLPSDKTPSAGGNSNDKRGTPRPVREETKKPVAAAELSSKFNTQPKLLFKSALTVQQERATPESKELHPSETNRTRLERANSVSFLKNVAAGARKALQIVPVSAQPYRLAADGMNGNFVDLDDPFLHESNAVGIEHSPNSASRRKLYERPAREYGAEDANQTGDGHAPLPAVLTRPTWLIAPGETLVSIAENQYSDPNIAWLIAELNREQSDVHWIDGKCIVEFNSRQQLTLPVWQDVEVFYSSRPGPGDPENLITIVKTTKLDRDVVENALSKVMGTSLPAPASVSLSDANDTNGSIEELTLRTNISI
ncbi:MAG: hypothetical protein K2W95_31415 [Candidatus Obscuribacterales bacterium]|nr:hypothetical protein [Candidatus Obscuribacterales bacterium]